MSAVGGNKAAEPLLGNELRATVMSVDREVDVIEADLEDGDYGGVLTAARELLNLADTVDGLLVSIATAAATQAGADSHLTLPLAQSLGQRRAAEQSAESPAPARPGSWARRPLRSP